MDVDLAKPRYEDVICYDQTRVVLKCEFGKKEPEDVGFVHANWLTTPGTQTKYILCEGSLENTLNDMWEMIFQEKVPVMVMCCQLIEDEYAKCE
uniref:Tyrosine-protein phosphatase domain-containing protein n=1 Tax=Rhabditophanes sp. KR3021 TaxID=114890 RepID=A0AC35TIB9_9BILA